MKTFLSWSGTQSHQIALTLRDWLPSVLQALRPYVSSEDIDKGARWSSDIAAELEDASYGIICVTQENLRAPWVHFEAGALSRSLDKSHVVPFLVGVRRSEVQGPLLQFQSVVFNRDDVLKLVQGLNRRLGEAERLTDPQLKKTFDVWWPELEGNLDALRERESPVEASKSDSSSSLEAILEELLELARANQRRLSGPDYFRPLGEQLRTEELRFRAEQVARAGVDLDPKLVSAAATFPELSRLRTKLVSLTDYLRAAEARSRLAKEMTQEKHHSDRTPAPDDPR
ncbi:MAG: TIR domain-containing protein [Acidobacteriota bacterium]